MAQLGEAVLELKTDSTQLTQGLKEAEKGAEGLSKKFQSVGRDMQRVGSSLTRNVSIPLAAVGAAFAAATVEAGRYADRILDLSQITGMSTDALQELEHVATVAGVSFDGLTSTIQRFSARLPQIEAGSSQAAVAFDELGVALRDSQGEIRNMDELFPELIAALQNIENVTERNAIAQQVFGRSLGDLAPVLGMTADEFRSARDEAHDLGLVLDGEALNAANDYRVEIETLGSQIKTLWRNFAVDLIPVIKDTVLPAFMSLLDSISRVTKWFGDLDAGLQKTILIAATAAAAIGPGIGLAGRAVSAAGAIKGLGVAFGLSNPLLAAFLVTLTAIVAGVGYLIGRARTAARERELLSNAITGNVESIEEYQEALEILERKEEGTARNEAILEDAIRATSDALKQQRARIAELRAAGYTDEDLYHPLRAEMELTAELNRREEELAQMRRERAQERAAIEHNHAELEEQLRRDQEEREAEEIAALNRRAEAIEEALRREHEDKMGAIDDETEARSEQIERWLREQMDAHDREVLMIEERRDMLLEAAGDDLELRQEIHQWAENSIAELVRKRRESEKKAADERARIEREANLERIRQEALIQDRINKERAKALERQLAEEARLREQAALEAGLAAFERGDGAAVGAAPTAEVDTADGGTSAADAAAAADAASSAGASAAAAAMIVVAMAAFDAMSSISGFSEAINALGTIMHHMARAVEPIVKSILPAVLWLYERIGATLGGVLVPIFEALGPILASLADIIATVLLPILQILASPLMVLAQILRILQPIFVALADEVKRAMLPIAVIAGVFNWLAAIIANLGTFIMNVIDRPMRPGTWNWGMVPANLGSYVTASMEAMWTGGDMSGVDTGGGGPPPGGSDEANGARGTAATYRQARPITINQDISDNFFLGGDRNMRDFALMLKEEFELLGVLNA